MHLLPRQSFDGLGIGLQCLDLLIQLLVFLLKLVNLLAETFHFLMFAAQSQEAVLPEHLVNKQSNAKKDKGVPGVTANRCCIPGTRIRSPY